jgi:hypothetical protein
MSVNRRVLVHLKNFESPGQQSKFAKTMDNMLTHISTSILVEI